MPSDSSAPSTPRPSKPPSTPLATGASKTTTPRKSPHCKSCGRPRKGHPLRSCESAAVAAVQSPRKPPAGEDSPARGTAVVDALEAARLAERDRQEKRARRVSQPQARPRIQSLPSISTITGELLDGLKEMGLGREDGQDDGGAKREAVMRWREGSDTPGAGQRGVKPGALPRMPALELTPRSKSPKAARPVLGSAADVPGSSPAVDDSTPTKKTDWEA
ncbi:hypothetical protein C8J57DRAFT_1475571 [Mycena rebaudengoi]|nr:hypothetical protein C8J57DRAFT_1475571 [Mycena rebaudengoi]